MKEVNRNNGVELSRPRGFVLYIFPDGLPAPENLNK